MSATYVLGLLGSLVTFGALFELLRRRRLREKYAVLWLVVAAFTFVLTIFPGLLTWLSQAIGVSVPSNLLFFVASIFLLLVSIQQSYELGRLEERSRTLAEEVALLRLEMKQLGRDDHT